MLSFIDRIVTFLIPLLPNHLMVLVNFDKFQHIIVGLILGLIVGITAIFYGYPAWVAILFTGAVGALKELYDYIANRIAMKEVHHVEILDFAATTFGGVVGFICIKVVQLFI